MYQMKQLSGTIFKELVNAMKDDISYADMISTIARLCSIKDRAELEYEATIVKYVKCTKNGEAFSYRADDIYRKICLIGSILGYTEDKIYNDIVEAENERDFI